MQTLRRDIYDRSCRSNLLVKMFASKKPGPYVLENSCGYTMGIIVRGCCWEAYKAEGIAKCHTSLRDHIQVQKVP